MAKRITAIVFSLVWVISMASLSYGFGNNANKVNPNDPKSKEQRPYTRENSTRSVEQGGYYGGHDTLTAEGMLLKKDVHKSDPDGGEKFKTWADEEALPSLRTGAHDEDTYRYPFTNRYYKDDRPIGANKDIDGNFFTHFLDTSMVYKTEEYGFYDLGAGLKGSYPPATRRARDYIKDIQKMICEAGGIDKLNTDQKLKIYDKFGRIEHLLQDMGNPAHTNNDIHIRTKTFEDYVEKNWGKIVSEVVIPKVTPEGYIGGNYGVVGISNPEEYLLSLANISKNYNYDGFLRKMSQRELDENVQNLIPLTIYYVGGYINSIYKAMTDPTDTSLREKGTVLFS